ncbi:MAG: hypothetical protein Q4F00_03165, partial [bacterium]|nr:hypothetical protein [bacterium]
AASADAEPEAEEWKPEVPAAPKPAAEEEQPAASADAEPEAEEWKPEVPAAPKPAAEEEQPAASADAEPEAEEWKPEVPAAPKPAAEEEQPAASADAEPEAEEWKPEVPAASKPAAEAAQAEPAEQEKVTLKKANLSKNASEAGSGVNGSEGSLSSIDKKDLLFKGRYADIVWETKSNEEVLTALSRCLELPSEETHHSLGELLRVHPWSWRVRLQLFNFEIEEGRPFYAYVVGWPLLYAPMRPAIKKMFKRDMYKVINDVIAYSVTPSEEHWKYLRLAELVIDEDQNKALEYVNKALDVHNGAVSEESRLRYYRQCLAGLSSESFKDCVIALQNIDSHIELFGDLQQSILQYCRGYRAVNDVIQALLFKGRETAKELESACELDGEEVNAGLLEKVHDYNADLLIELIFNQIYKRIPMPDVVARTPEEEELLQNSKTLATPKFPALGMLRRLNRAVFNLDYDAKVYYGDKKFWIEIVVGEKPTLVLHNQFGILDSVTQQALLLYRLFQLHHRHHIVRRIHDVLSDKDRLHLMQVLCDIAKDSGTDPGAEFRAILNNIKEDDINFEDKLEKLVNAMFMRTGSFEFSAGHELMFAKRPFTDILDAASDRFVARVVGMTDASYSIALRQVTDLELFERIENEGFSVIYEPQYSKYFLLRLRLQRLWTAPLQEELWF